MEIEPFTAYLARLGDEVAAKKLGRTPRTIQSWRLGARSPRLADVPNLIARAEGELALESFFPELDHGAPGVAPVREQRAAGGAAA